MNFPRWKSLMTLARMILIGSDEIEAWLRRIELRPGRRDVEIPSKVFKKSLALLAGEMASGYHPRGRCPG